MGAINLAPCSNSQEIPNVPAASKLEILEHHSTIDKYRDMTVSGTVKNTWSSRISLASIRVKFYDSAGNIFESGFDFVEDIEPGGIDTFQGTRPVPNNIEFVTYTVGVGSIY